MYKNNLYHFSTSWATHKGVLEPDADEDMDAPVFPAKEPKSNKSFGVSKGAINKKAKRQALKEGVAAPKAKLSQAAKDKMAMPAPSPADKARSPFTLNVWNAFGLLVRAAHATRTPRPRRARASLDASPADLC